MENHKIEQGPPMTDLERDEAKERRKTRLLCYYIAARFALICCIITVVPVATFLIIIAWFFTSICPFSSQLPKILKRKENPH